MFVRKKKREKRRKLEIMNVKTLFVKKKKRLWCLEGKAYVFGILPVYINGVPFNYAAKMSIYFPVSLKFGMRVD